MTWLSLIQYVAFGLAGTAIVAAVILIGTKAIRMKTEKWREERRAILVNDFLASLEEMDSTNSLVKRMRASPRIACDIFDELAVMVRGENRTRLLNIAREADLMSWLQKQLRSGRKHARQMAAETLRFFDDEKTVATLRCALDDPDDDVRIAAALSLTEMGRAPQLSELVQQLTVGSQTRSLQLRQIFHRMAAIDRQGIVDLALGRIGNTTLRPLAVETLGTMSANDAGPILRLLVRDKMPQLRKAAIDAIATLALSDSATLIVPALSDENWEVRLAAINATRQLDLVEAVSELGTLAHDDVWWVRLHAIEALVDLGESGVRALMQIKASDDQQSSALAAMVLNKSASA